MSYEKKRGFVNLYKIMALTALGCCLLLFGLKSKYRYLASNYLQSADKVGKYYALSCFEHEDACRQLLKKAVESSGSIHWADGLYRDHSLEKQYHQAVLDAFEKRCKIQAGDRSAK